MGDTSLTFDDWFYGMQNYQCRSDKFIDDFLKAPPEYKNDIMIRWLKEAYIAGVEHARQSS